MVNTTNLTGQTLDNQYQIEKLLGQGGMGDVYKAYHLKLGDVVAIKIMPPHISSNPENQRRFFREGKAVRSFKHPNAITLYDLRETSDGTLYMVLEYIEGNTLRSVINNKGRFSPEEALEIIEPIASALYEAHKIGVIHRDVKPENIMVSYNNEGFIVKLLDLGIAKIAGATSLTVEGQVLGTPYYMSPEQWGIYSEQEIIEKTLEIDGRADIYSLGVILYEMVTGQKPFTGATIQELAVKHISTIPILAKTINPDLPESFSQTIAKIISKERINRPINCQELIHQLHKSLEQLEDQECHTLPINEITNTPENNSDSTIPLVREVFSPNNRREISNNQLTTSKTDNLKLADTKSTPTPLTNKEKNPLNSEEIKVKIHQLMPNYFRYLVVATILTSTILLTTFYNWKHLAPEKTVLTTTNPIQSKEVLRYWLEIVTQKNETLREAKNIAINSGDMFQFHLESKELAYLYILMPGKKNKLTTLLTSKPIPKTGVKDNLIKANSEYKFPNGESWISIGKNDISNKFVFIFSIKAIESIPFLNKPAGYELSEEDSLTLQTLRKQACAIELETITGSSSYVIINSIKPLRDTDYIVYEVDIKLK